VTLPLCPQGAVLTSSDRGGIRIQYSKNPFGRREPGASSPGLATGVNHFGSPMTESLAASLATSQNSPRVGLGTAGLLSSLNGSATSSAGGAAVVTGPLAPVLVGHAGLEQILNSEM
jgi:hypothetical protein